MLIKSCLKATCRYAEDRPISRIGLTDIQDEVLDFLRDCPVSVDDIAHRMSLSLRTVRRTITELKQSGYDITVKNELYCIEDNGEDRYCLNVYCNGVGKPKKLSKYNRGNLCYNCQDRLNNARAVAAVCGKRLNTKLGDKANTILHGLYENRGRWICINNLSKFRGTLAINKILDTIRRNGYDVESEIRGKEVWAVVR